MSAFSARTPGNSRASCPPGNPVYAVWTRQATHGATARQIRQVRQGPGKALPSRLLRLGRSLSLTVVKLSTWQWPQN